MLTITSRRESGVQPAVVQPEPSLETMAQSDEFCISSVPERYRVPTPVYEFTAPFATLALPSMKIVPFSVKTRLVASQESSPAVVLQL